MLLETGNYRSDNVSNYLGTFTFASLADYEAGRPSTWSQRTGDPNLTYSTLQAAVYVQDDWRIARRLLLTGGVRYGVQRHVSDGWNLSPRATFAWSPLRNGNLTLRGSYGYFYDWIAGDLYKQTLLFDGVRQREINIVNPAFPDPAGGGTAPPTNRYLLAEDLAMAYSQRLSAGLAQTLSPRISANVLYSYSYRYALLAGRNLNAPASKSAATAL